MMTTRSGPGALVLIVALSAPTLAQPVIRVHVDATELPRKLLRKGVRDMVRISDARMSGTAFGTVVLHVTPEAAIGGPLGLVQNGDMIELDTPNGKLDLLVDAAELERRRKSWKAPDAKYDRGYGQMYSQHVLQAGGGCDFDFLRGNTPVELRV